MVPTLAGVILLIFFLFKFFGGDPAEILGGLNATPEQIAAIRQQLEALDEQLGRVRDRIDPERFAQFERAFERGRDVLTRLETGLALGQQLVELVDRGQGTVGGLLHDHELRDFAKRLQRIIKRQGWEVLGHPSNLKLR